MGLGANGAWFAPAGLNRKLAEPKEPPVCFGKSCGKKIGCDGCPHMMECSRKMHTDRRLDKCPECGKGLEKRSGKYGEFLGCAGYPTCRYTRNPGIVGAIEIKDNPPEPRPQLYLNPNCLGTTTPCPRPDSLCSNKELCLCLRVLNRIPAYQVSGQDDSAKIPQVFISMEDTRLLIEYAFPDAQIIAGDNGRPFRILILNGKPSKLYMMGQESPTGQIVLKSDGRYRFEYHGAGLDVHDKDKLQWAALK